MDKSKSNSIIDIFHSANLNYPADGSLDSTSGYLGGGCIACEMCGYGELSEDNGFNIDGDIYCESCYNEYFACCDDCYETVRSDNIVGIHAVHDDICYVCVDCRDENYTYCEACNEYYYNDNVTIHGDYGYCESCFGDLFSKCDCCNEYHSNDVIVDYDSIGAICNDCYNAEYYTCDCCGEVFSNDAKVEHENKEYCHDCFIKEFSLIKDVV